jgi:hypothetical protein
MPNDRSEHKFENQESKPPEQQAFSGLDLLKEGKQLQAGGNNAAKMEFASWCKTPESLKEQHEEFFAAFEHAKNSPEKLTTMMKQNVAMLDAAQDHILNLNKKLEKSQAQV